MECTQDYAMAIYKLMEVNYCSLIIQKALSGSLSDTVTRMVASMAKQSLVKLEEINKAFAVLSCQQGKEIRDYIVHAKNHFEVLVYWCIFKANLMEQDNLCEKTKSIEAVVVENYLLGKHLMEKVGHLESLLKKCQHDFNTGGNCKHTLSLLNGQAVAQFSE